MTVSGVLDALRPFLWLLLIAMLSGAASYMALSGSPHGHAAARPRVETVSGPSSSDWNLPKHI